MYIEKPIKTYVDELASSSPTPGGGGTGALVAALGIALGDMVGELTVGKKKYEAVEDEIKALMEEAQKLKLEFLRLVDADAEAFEPLSKAYGIPKDDPNRDEIMEKALRDAAAVPLEILRNCKKGLGLIEAFAEKGSKLAISDAGCGASLCGAALESAALNVFINTKYMKDRGYADSINAEVEETLQEYREKSRQIYEFVASNLK